MSYDFTTIVDRSGSGSEKWARLVADHPVRPENIVPFSTADMEFVTAPAIVGGLKTCIETEVFGYTSPNDAYYNAVLSFFRERHGWEVKRDELVLFDGVVNAFMACVRAYTQPGEGVLVMTPVYGPFFFPAGIGRKIVKSQLVKGENGSYTIDFDDFEKKAAQSKLFLFCSPHNPAGRVWTKDELIKIAGICEKHGLVIVSDEIHFDLVMPGFKHHVLPTAVPGIEHRTVVCTAPSKTFNLPGLMCANIVVKNEEMRKKLIAERHGGVNMLGLRACQHAYGGAREWLDECIGVVYDNYAVVKRFFNDNNPSLTVTPLEGTYLAWIDMRPLGLDRERLHSRLREKMLYFNEGEWFGDGGEGHIRMNIACPKRAVEAALERMLPVIRP